MCIRDRAFGTFAIANFDLYAIEPRRLRYDSPERGLLSEALARAICRVRPLISERRRSSRFLTVDPADEGESALADLRKLTGTLTGQIPDTSLGWREAAEVRIENRLGQLWLIILPTVWVESTDDRESRAARADFVRERTAARYNNTWNSLIDAWTSIITGGAEKCDLHSFGISDGVDGVFTVSRITGFSRPEVGQWKGTR